MFDLTAEEREKMSRLTAAEQQKAQFRQRLSGYGFHGDEREQLAASLKVVTDELDELEVDPAMQIAMFKTMLNEGLKSKLQGFAPSTIVTMLEEMAGLADSETATRLTGLAKGLLLRAYVACADPDLAKARAELLHARYMALLTVGLPYELVAQILVAEASRPFPSIPTNMNSK